VDGCDRIGEVVTIMVSKSESNGCGVGGDDCCIVCIGIVGGIG
jgi:hypothetical protein